MTDETTDALREAWLEDTEAVEAQLIQHVQFRVKELSSPDPDIRAAAGRRLADARAALGEPRPDDPT